MPANSASRLLAFGLKRFEKRQAPAIPHAAITMGARILQILISHYTLPR
jgi:hypothetical protein